LFSQYYPFRRNLLQRREELKVIVYAKFRS
jgi:hypothetical protein